MKRRDKKEKYIQVRGDNKDLMKKFDLEMRMARKQPKIHYSREGQIKTVE